MKNIIILSVSVLFLSFSSSVLAQNEFENQMISAGSEGSVQEQVSELKESVENIDQKVNDLEDRVNDLEQRVGQD